MSLRNEANEAVDQGTFVSAYVAVFRVVTLCENSSLLYDFTELALCTLTSCT